MIVQDTLVVLASLGDIDATLALLGCEAIEETLPGRTALVSWHRETDSFETYLEAT